MASTIEIHCAVCGAIKQIRKAEYDRQQRRGRSYFFCSRSCSAIAQNAPKRVREVVKCCPQCGDMFNSNTGAKAATYCSRSCASSASVTEKRRMRAREIGQKNLQHDANQTACTLRSREGWKYAKIAPLLVSMGISHQFEYSLENKWIFDLALFESRILVEFDGPYHCGNQRTVDLKKTKTAEACGWKVLRISVPVGVIQPAALNDLLSATP